MPHYGLSVKLKFDLVELGDMDLFEENEVDADKWTGWIPFAYVAKEPLFLAIHTETPYRVGMWEHENGKIYDVWASLDDFTGRVLESKKDKTPYELLDKLLRHDKKPVPGTWYFVNPLAKDCLIPEKCHFVEPHRSGQRVESVRLRDRREQGR